MRIRKATRIWRRSLCPGALSLAFGLTGTSLPAQQLNPEALAYTLPDDIDWVADPGGGSDRAILYGDPAEPGPYGYFIRWNAGNMSRPHYHPNDRYIIVVSGVWWVGTGSTFDPDSTVALPPGTFVVHYGGEVHYDGAKTGDAVMLIQGIGPATSTPAEAP